MTQPAKGMVILNRVLRHIVPPAFIIAIIFAFAGCAQLADVAAPDVQAVNAQMQQMEATVETDRIYDFITINGISVGGLTAEEAVLKVTEELEAPIKNQKIIVSYKDKTWPLTLSSLNYRYEVEKAVQEAYSVARAGSVEERYEKIMSLEASPYEITIQPSYDKGRITAFLTEIAREVNIPATEPSLVMENRETKTAPGEDGIAVDMEKTGSEIEALADLQAGGEVPLAMETVSPQFTVEELLDAHSLIGSFSTPITGSASRDVNLTVASGYVNGVTLYPDQVFSTNAVIGPTTYDRGYRNAPVIVNGKLEDGIGGGVCQVSSTLYNAVLFSELEIVQRQNHSLVVGYCPIGRDATLAGDVIDFKFKNNTEYPIYIESYLEGKELFVNIYGKETRPPNRTLEFYSVHVSSTAPPASKEIPDPNLAEGERVAELAPITGQVVDVYKRILIDGKETETVYVDRSSYRARAGEIRVGTGPAAPVEPEAPAQVEPPVDNSVPPEWIGGDTPPAAPDAYEQYNYEAPLDFTENEQYEDWPE